MIRDFRRALQSIPVLVAAVQDLQGAVHEALTAHVADEGIERRVRALEGALHAVEAESEALVVKAESKLAAARSAEERTRRMMKRAQEAEEAADAVDEEGLESLREWARIFSGEDAGGSEEDGLHAVRSDVEVSRPALEGKELAIAFKHGRI